MAGNYVVISKFRVANGMAERVAEAFRQRPHLVDSAPGFLGIEILSPTDDDAEFWLVTRWTDESSFRTWHHSHAYRESHGGIPHGLKLDPTATEVRRFHHVAS